MTDDPLVAVPGLQVGMLVEKVLSWSRLSEQNLRVDKWSVCRG